MIMHGCQCFFKNFMEILKQILLSAFGGTIGFKQTPGPEDKPAEKSNQVGRQADTLRL
jgi:hypothetical protein